MRELDQGLDREHSWQTHYLQPRSQVPGRESDGHAFNAHIPEASEGIHDEKIASGCVALGVAVGSGESVIPKEVDQRV